MLGSHLSEHTFGRWELQVEDDLALYRRRRRQKSQLTGGLGSLSALNLGDRTAGDGTVLEVPLGES